VAEETFSAEKHSVTQTINIPFLSNSPDLSRTEDSDNDGVNDAQEGLFDYDNDGIAAYLDNDNNTSYLPLSDVHKPIQTVAGSSISLGSIIKSSSSPLVANGIISEADLASFATGLGLDNTIDSHAQHISPMINFIISGNDVSNDGAVVVVPLPDNVIIPAEASFRKYISNQGWFDFIENGKNSLSSALLDNNNNCPTPQSTEYLSGLNLGHQCIQLIIEDGGPNDADGEINGQVEDPGVLTSFINTAPIIDVQTSVTVNENSQVSVSASNSSDADGDDLIYTWVQLNGVNVEINSPNAASLSFSSPAVESQVNLSFLLMVNDGYTSVEEQVNVQVNNIVPAAEQSSSSGGSINIYILLTLLSLFIYRNFSLINNRTLIHK
jgi:hypothetical protein